MKELFSHEIKKVEELKNSLKYHQKLNGTQVILSGPNKRKIRKVSSLLDEVSKLLLEVK
jgi:hypothetical protein